MVNETHISRNVRSIDSTLSGALIRLSQDGTMATVLVRDTGKLARISAASLYPTKGRPVKLIKGLCRADVDELIDSNVNFCFKAIEELFGRQTEDERVTTTTRHENKVGFRADDAKLGSKLAMTDAWNQVDLVQARQILRAYSGTQLWDLASEFLSAQDEAGQLIASILDGSIAN